MQLSANTSVKTIEGEIPPCKLTLCAATAPTSRETAN